MNYSRLIISTILIFNTFQTSPISFTTLVDENNIAQASRRLAEELSKATLAHTHQHQVTYETTELLAKIGDHMKEHPIRHEVFVEEKTVRAIAYIIIVLTGSCGVAVSTYQQSWGMLAVNIGLILGGIVGLKKLSSTP